MSDTVPPAGSAPADRRSVRTMCPMNCHPTLCGMRVEVGGGRLLAVAGDEDNPDSQGFLCVRGQATRDLPHHPDRLLHPLVRDRRDQPFRRATWDEALDRIAAAIAAGPPAATALWPGHGTFSTNYGTRINAQLMARFAHLHGCHFWNPTMVCWGLGAFGLALTGILETHTNEDLAAHANLVVAWGASLGSQPNTARHLLAARERGAGLVAIDVRRTELAAKADEVLLVRPGSDAALALALLHVICGEGLHDAAFVARHAVGFDALAEHVRAFTPAWAAERTGVPAERIVALARRYAATRPATILLGGSSMHKGGNAWQAARAIACLPAVTGQLGVPGAGFGVRHGGAAHGRGLATVVPPRPPGTTPPVPSQMAAVTAALRAGRIGTLLTLGTNLLSSFADANAVAEGLGRTRCVVVYDLFLNETARRFADVVLPSTLWLEELGAKATHTHLYLMEPALPPAGECWPVHRLLTALAARIGLPDYFPWPSDEALIDTILAHPSTGPATVASLRAAGGHLPLKVSPVAYPTLRFDTPSGRVELWSEQAMALGLPALPSMPADAGEDAPRGPATAPTATPADAPLVLAHGRTLAHFHAFYEHGRALPMLARREPEPVLWIAPADAAARGVADGGAIRIANERGALEARARVTEQVPPGTVWMRDGWMGLNTLTDGRAVLPDAAAEHFVFSAGQARFDARVTVVPA